MAIYMKLSNIVGAVSAKQHSGWIEVESYHVAMFRKATVAVGRGVKHDSGLPSLGRFEITKRADQSSISIFDALLSGQVIESCQINLMRTGNGVMVHSEYLLGNVVVAQYEDSALESGDNLEYISLAYHKIERKFTPYKENNDPGNPLVTGYDLVSASKA